MGELRLARVQAALLVLGDFPPPAPGARVLARHHRARAGRAADRAVALVVEAVVGELMRGAGLPHPRPPPPRGGGGIFEGRVVVENALRGRGAGGRKLAGAGREPYAPA